MSEMRESIPPPPDNEGTGAVEQDEPEIFDPNVHASDKKSGKPIRNKDGSLRLKPGVKKKSNSNGAGAAPGIPLSPEGAAPAGISSAVVLTGTIENICKILISPAWTMTDEERQGAIESWSRLLDRYNIGDLPASLSVLAIYGTYTATRLESDNETRGKFSRLWDRFCGWMGSRMIRSRFGGKKKPKKQEESNAENN